MTFRTPSQISTPTSATRAATTAVAAPPAHSRPASPVGRGGGGGGSGEAVTPRPQAPGGPEPSRAAGDYPAASDAANRGFRLFRVNETGCRTAVSGRGA